MSADEFGVEVQGLKELQKAFLKIPVNMRKNSMKRVLRAEAKKVRDGARNKAPKSTITFRQQKLKPGRLKRAIKHRVRNTRKYKNFFLASVAISPGVSREDPKGAFYGRFVEFGHRITSSHGGFHNAETLGEVPARPFLRPALEERKNNIKNSVIAAVREEINKEIGKLKLKR